MPTPLPNSVQVLKPIYLVDALGEYARMPDGAIVNIGGVIGPNFTVAGKPLLYADGTSTDGSPVTGNATDFQSVYEHSTPAFISTHDGKDIVFHSTDGHEFIFDATTGLITITGDLHVLGTTTQVINTDIISEKVWIHQSAGDYIPFWIEPKPGVTPTVDLVSISVLNGQPPVFTIDPTGLTHIQNLDVTGTINGIDLGVLNTALLDHINLASPGIKHKADQISVDSTNLAPSLQGDTVQEVLENISSSITNINNEGFARGYEHIQQVAQNTWTIVHGQNTRRVQITVWDSADEMVFADTVTIFDSNTVIVTYNTPITGRAILMLF